jgi:uncharacterized protein YjbI with pentapeptide repeats
VREKLVVSWQVIGMLEERDLKTAQLDEKAGKRPPLRSRLWARTGLGDKTLWDLLQLLIVPLVLAAIEFWLTAQQEWRRGAGLGHADLSGTNLKGANVTEEQLAECESLEGATMPDGTRYP